jgi:acetate kinase
VVGLMRVLAVNTGSTSLKLRLLDGDELVAGHDVQRWSGDDAPLRDFLAEHTADAIGHRVVHGGMRVVEPTMVNDEVMRYLATLTDLAPLHQPRALAAIRSTVELVPDVPSVVCVDTAFHSTLSDAAATYALPREWNRKWFLRRYGFHGLSHAYAVARAAEVGGMRPGRGRVLSCHIGAGVSLAAVRDGRCVDTTMGYTPDEGVVMATRSGSVDPGLLDWLINARGVRPGELFDGLRTRSGLAGLSGTSGDLRDILDARDRGDRDAMLAFDVFRHSLTRHAGAMIAVLGGLDLLVFTGGVGEHQPPVRAALARDLGFLGVAVDSARNESITEDVDISATGAEVRTVVVEAREDLEIAQQTRDALQAEPL